MRLTAILIGLGLAAPAHASDVFYADANLTPVTVVEDDIGLLLDGELRAWRTGNMAIKVDNPRIVQALEAWPEIAYIEAVRPERGIYKIIGARGVDEIALSREITRIPGVRFCHPDLEYETVLHTLDDPLIDVTWHLNNTGERGGLPGVDVGAFEAWEITQGEGQIIAIVDTGVDMTHPDLDLLPGYDFGAGDADPTPDPEYDGYSHGTAMAGVAGSIGDNGIGTAGIAPRARILPIKLLGNEQTSDFTVYDAWTFAADQGASVISNSWGRGQDCQRVPISGIIQDALDYVELEGRDGKGAVVAMSAGNDGCDNSASGFHTHPTVVSVGASTDIDEKASYSNYGPILEVMGFGAGNGRPGLWTTDITGELGYNGQEDGDYWSGASGTSSACASVAGVTALMFAANDRLTAAEAREILCETAVKPAWDNAAWDADGRSPLYGCGRVDAAAAVATVANAGAPIVELQDPGALTTDLARFSWTGEDPDGDALSYELSIWFEGSEDEPVFEGRFDKESAILDGKLYPAAIPYGWSVTPIDAWGRGETVVGPAFTVSPPAEEPRACASVSATHAGSLALLSLLGLLLARRREGACAE